MQLGRTTLPVQATRRNIFLPSANNNILNNNKGRINGFLTGCDSWGVNVGYVV